MKELLINVNIFMLQLYKHDKIFSISFARKAQKNMMKLLLFIFDSKTKKAPEM
jgi:hypothetical protein